MDGDLGRASLGIAEVEHEGLIYLEDGLDCSFAVGGGFPDHDGPVVVLQGGHNLGGGGTVWPRKRVPKAGEIWRPNDAGVAVDVFLDPAGGVFDLDDWSGADKEAGKFDSFTKEAATVVAEVEAMPWTPASFNLPMSSLMSPLVEFFPAPPP